MDLITHVALGVVVAEAFGGDTNRKRLLATGAFAQSFPDIDIIGALWMRPDINVMFHRGITHSLLAAVVFPLFFTAIRLRVIRSGNQRAVHWLAFFFVQYAVHLFIDSFNAYGVGLLEPFSNRKFSLHTLYVLDPIIIFIAVAAALAILLAGNPGFRRRVVSVTLVLISVYILYTVRNRFITEQRVEERLSLERVEYDRLLVTPTGFNSWLWFIAAESDSGYFVFHRSIYETERVDSIAFYPRNAHLLTGAEDELTLRNLAAISDGFYTVEQWSDTLVFNVLRFGQTQGWANSSNHFSFHYFLDYPDANKTVMQRGRVSGWNAATVRALFRRIKGEREAPLKKDQVGVNAARVDGSRSRALLPRPDREAR